MEFVVPVKGNVAIQMTELGARPVIFIADPRNKAHSTMAEFYRDGKGLYMSIHGYNAYDNSYIMIDIPVTDKESGMKLDTILDYTTEVNRVITSIVKTAFDWDDERIRSLDFRSQDRLKYSLMTVLEDNWDTLAGVVASAVLHRYPSSADKDMLQQCKELFVNSMRKYRELLDKPLNGERLVFYLNRNPALTVASCYRHWLDTLPAHLTDEEKLWVSRLGKELLDRFNRVQVETVDVYVHGHQCEVCIATDANTTRAYKIGLIDTKLEKLYDGKTVREFHDDIVRHYSYQEGVRQDGEEQVKKTAKRKCRP